MSHKLPRLEVYEHLKKRNPIDAAQFFARHFTAIREERDWLSRNPLSNPEKDQNDA